MTPRIQALDDASALIVSVLVKQQPGLSGIDLLSRINTRLLQESRTELRAMMEGGQ